MKALREASKQQLSLFLIGNTCFTMLHRFQFERVMARDFDRQVAELQVRAAVLNRFTRLGTPVTVPVL
jgi:hypothetical protein